MTENYGRSRISQADRLTAEEEEELRARCLIDLISYIDFAWLMLWETPRHAHFLVKTANQIAENILDEAKKRDLEVSDSPKTEQLAFSDVFECARARYENWALAFDRIKAMRDDGLDRQTYRERARVENALNDLKIPSNDCPKQLRLLLFAATRYLGASGAEESHEFPKSAEICKFLVQSGATPTVAKQIAKIIRPDSLLKPTHK